MAKRNKIKVDGAIINISSNKDQDYICLTDMVSNQTEGSKLIEKWLTSKNTIEFLGIWEQLNNVDFNSPEFGVIMSEAGTNRFYMSVKQWINRTNAKGIEATAGRYGGTYAHREIAFNFALYISPMFNLVLIKEYERLKQIESDTYNLEWDVRRILSKTNYKVHTDAVKKYIIPKARYSSAKEWLAYADEADVLNIALFGCTAKQWKASNPSRALKGENIRDMASINELAILSNIESLNSTLIKNNVSKKDRLRILMETVYDQRKSLDEMDVIKSLKKESDTTYIDAKENKIQKLSKFNQNLIKGIEHNPKEDKK